MPRAGSSRVRICP